MGLEAYRQFIAQKKRGFEARGIKKWRHFDESLRGDQVHGVEFALRAGCSALFYDTGLGKSRMSHVWAQRIIEATNKPCLLLAPLAVGHQHAREAASIGVDAQVIRDGSEATGKKIYIINYDRMDRIDPAKFGSVILDESSIIKNFTGATTRKLTESFAKTPYRLCCTATPAPNDFTEIGTHAEFLSVMRRDEMLPIWFIHDSADTGTWRIKGHAQDDFWNWVAGWARCVEKPSDIGFSDKGFDLPDLIIHHHEVKADLSLNCGAEDDGQHRLFRMPECSATSIHREKRLSLDARADAIAAAVLGEPMTRWLIWCETNEEEDALVDRIPGASAIRGSQNPDEKEARMIAFLDGKTQHLVTKASIAGFGINAQCCSHMAFVGLSFSFEQYYQAVRRCWRFGQTKPVHVHIAGTEAERSIQTVISRNSDDHGAMKQSMRRAMSAVASKQQANVSYQPGKAAIMPAWL